MSEEQFKAFLEKVKDDTKLQEKINGTADADAVVEIAKAAGFAITSEDIQSMRSESVELSDEALSDAVGGTLYSELVKRAGGGRLPRSITDVFHRILFGKKNLIGSRKFRSKFRW